MGLTDLEGIVRQYQTVWKQYHMTYLQLVISL